MWGKWIETIFCWKIPKYREHHIEFSEILICIWGSILYTCVIRTPCLPKILGTKIPKKFLFYVMLGCNQLC